jgi:hypothetical protein
MSKAEIIAELPSLNPEERREVLDKICQLERIAGDEWLDTTDLTDADTALLETRLAGYQGRIRARLNP